MYGTSIATAYRFSVPLPEIEGPADLSFVCTDEAPSNVDWSTATVVDQQGSRPDGTSTFVFAELVDRDVVRISGALEYHLWPDRIVCHVIDSAHRYLIDIALFGMVLALWLERRGVPVLHASAVVIDGDAVGFLAGSGSGKTSTATACLARGHELLTEDLLAIDDTGDGFEGRPGYPMLRLWPDQAERFVGAGWELLDVARPDMSKRRVPVARLAGRFRETPTPIRRLYLPERLDGVDGIVIERVAVQEAMMALVRHSFLPTEVHKWGLQPARLAAFAKLAADVPVARVRFPNGYDRLASVVAALEDDLAG